MNEELENQNQHSGTGPGSREPIGLWRAAALGGAVFAVSSIPFLLAVVFLAMDRNPERKLQEYLPEAFVIAALLAIWFASVMTLGAVWKSNDGKAWRALRAEEERARAIALQGKPGPFQAVPQRPFAARLSGFTGQHGDDSRQRESAAEPGQSKMPFYPGVTLGKPFRPKTAAYIREILQRIRRALRDSAG